MLKMGADDDERCPVGGAFRDQFNKNAEAARWHKSSSTNMGGSAVEAIIPKRGAHYGNLRFRFASTRLYQMDPLR